MDILSIAILAFATIEALNVMILYLSPGSNRGNGMGAFKAYEKSKDHPEIHALVSYLVNWVAGTKLIFIGLLVVIAFLGSDKIKLLTIFTLVLTIMTFYWRLFPSIKRMDQEDQIQPRGYSRTLGIMIGLFVGAFLMVAAVHLGLTP